MGESANSSVGLADLALLLQEEARKKFSDTYTNAGLIPIRCIYYDYLQTFHREPENVLEMIKGYSFLILSRRTNG